MTRITRTRRIGWLVAAGVAGAVAFAPVAGATPDPLVPDGPNPQVGVSLGHHASSHDEIDTSNGLVDLPF
jgi:hypothetical protein